jgi:hypothetical protein
MIHSTSERTRIGNSTSAQVISEREVKVHPRTGHEGSEGGKRYGSTLSLTSTLDVVGGQRHAPATLPPEKSRCLLYRRLGGP